MARRTPPIDDEKRRLELELFIARQTILLLMPEDIQEYLEGHWACESYQDIVAWRSWCVHGFVRLAESGPIYGLEINRPQARCPLCKGEPASARSSGYALPTGLERHLTGYGRMSQLTSAACSGAPISRRWRCIGAASGVIRRSDCSQAVQSPGKRKRSRLPPAPGLDRLVVCRQLARLLAAPVLRLAGHRLGQPLGDRVARHPLPVIIRPAPTIQVDRLPSNKQPASEDVDLERLCSEVPAADPAA